MVDIFSAAVAVATAHDDFLSGRASPPNQSIGLQQGQALALTALLEKIASGEKKILLVCRNQQEMELQKQLLLFHRPNLPLFLYPPFDDTPDGRRARALTLFALQHHAGAMVVVSCYQAMMEYLPPPSFFSSRVVTISQGQDYSMARLLEQLLALGYEPTAEVRTVGDMVRHGGIIDVFPIIANDQQHLPLRIDFFGDQVEGIYYFSPLDQRRLLTAEKISSVTILPMVEVPFDNTAQKNFLFRMREEFSLLLPQDIFAKSFFIDSDLQYYRPLFFDGKNSFFDHLKKDFMIFLLGRASNEVAQHHAVVGQDYQDRQEEHAMKSTPIKNKKINSINDIALPPLPPDTIILSPDQWQEKIKDFFTVDGHAHDENNNGVDKNHDGADENNNRVMVQMEAQPLHSSWQQLFIHLSHHGSSGDIKDIKDKKNDGAFYHDLLVAIKESPTSFLIAVHNIASLHRWQEILAGDDMPPLVVATPQKITSTQKVASQQITSAQKFSDLLADKKKKIILAVLPLRHGEQWGDDLTVITDYDIFQVEFQWSPPPARTPSTRATVEKLIKDITTLKKGDLITHIDYGIGQFLGLRPITAGGRVHDCVALEYRDGDKIFLPIENLDKLQRYGDLPDPMPNINNILDKLGSADWQMRVAKTRAHIKELATKLARNAALRQAIKAEPLLAKDSDYLEFASLFPYPETRDQEQAIVTVKDDLARNRPMDRLVCGDVGFGKTEVALRASFCAVMAGKQVLVITPTTLLARQHYHHFAKRFENFGVRVKQLSRFVSVADGKKIKDDINNGLVDIVVGTHGLLHRSVMPKNLGLVVIDEEHHFGVKQKERARELAKNVHLLAMSATPIPRSLQLSLHGIKDLSLIATPPPGRLPIKTTVAHLDGFIIKRVIKNEMARGGQVFLVAPRVSQLEAIKKSLNDLVPEMKITDAHGQMASDDIDQSMTDFADGKYHGLLSTNIIESGLDLPNVNSIIIFHGDQFGLAQLYQLRGRVGRSTKQGYCFITYPKDKPLTKNAKKRLELLDGLNHLGAGFTLASHDLDLRGAGNLLGEEQSGHIKEVGVELYQKMVMAALAALSDKDLADGAGGDGVDVAGDTSGKKDDKGDENPLPPSKDSKTRISPDWSPHIVLPLAVAIPEDYIPDEMVRLALYKELSESLDEKNLQEIESSLQDRFGAIPTATKNLLLVIELKQLCYAANISELKITLATRASMTVAFHDNHIKRPDKLFGLVKQKKASVVKETIHQHTPQQKTMEKIIFHLATGATDKIIAASKNILTELCAVNG